MNPVAPYEWTVEYADGTRFPRVRQGVVRTTRQAPRTGIVALRVQGPRIGSARCIPRAHTAVDDIVARTVIVWPISGGSARILAWRFGFRHGPDFVGLEVMADGRIRQHG